MTYFETCGTLDEAKSAYRRYAAALHPDMGGDAIEFSRMRAAFEAFTPSSEKYDGERMQWNAKDFADVIEQLMTIPGITIEICGSFIWVDGLDKDNKLGRDAIKSIDGGEAMNSARFAPKKKLWYFEPKGYRRRQRGRCRSFYSQDDIRSRYGSSVVAGRAAIS